MLKYSFLQLTYWVNQMEEELEEEQIGSIVKKALNDEYVKKIVAKLRLDHKLEVDDIHNDDKEIVIQTSKDLTQVVKDLILKLADVKAEFSLKKYIHKDNEKEGKNTSQSMR